MCSALSLDVVHVVSLYMLKHSSVLRLVKRSSFCFFEILIPYFIWRIHIALLFCEAFHWKMRVPKLLVVASLAPKRYVYINYYCRSVVTKYNLQSCKQEGNIFGLDSSAPIFLTHSVTTFELQPGLLVSCCWLCYLCAKIYVRNLFPISHPISIWPAALHDRIVQGGLLAHTTLPRQSTYVDLDLYTVTAAPVCL